MINQHDLRKRFTKVVTKYWEQNNHSLSEIPCVYAMLAFDIFSKETDILYIGSTTKLFSRYKSHKIPVKIQKLGKLNLMYFLPMNKGFYDYEIKLIKKLQPFFNKQHR